MVSHVTDEETEAEDRRESRGKHIWRVNGNVAPVFWDKLESPNETNIEAKEESISSCKQKVQRK